MAISRAFTKKALKEDRPSMAQAPSRSFFSSKPAPSIRNKISSPLALLSTTNQLAYNAPDLFPTSLASTPASATSKTFAPLTLSTSISTPLSDQDEVPELLHSNSSTPDSSTRGSTPTSTEPNHLSGYFAAALEEKRKSDEAPQRTMSRAGKVGELLNRKRSESRVRSPSLGHGAAKKPSLQSIDSGPLSAKSSAPSWQPAASSQTSVASPVTPQFAPAPFKSESKAKSPTGEKFAPSGFTPAPFSSAPKSAGLAPMGGGGLMRKNTVRARGSVDMFSPNMGVYDDETPKEKPDLSNLRERRAEDSKAKNITLTDRAIPEEKLTVRPSISVRGRQISNPSAPFNPRSPMSPKSSASHADLRGQAQERHPALRAKASLNIRPATSSDKITPPVRSYTTNNAPSAMGLRKASPIDEAMATLDEVAKDFNVVREVQREEKKQFKSVGTAAAQPKMRVVEGEKTFMAENAHMFTAVDYMSEIQDLTEYLFPELRRKREAEGRREMGRERERFAMGDVVQKAQMQQYNMI